VILMPRGLIGYAIPALERRLDARRNQKENR